MKILIADDESEIRTVLKLILEGAGYSVIEAKDGTGAVEAVEADRGIDLCIMDIMMPGLDGFGAVKQIKKIADIPTIMLSARCEEYDKLFGFELGVDDYVTKPFSPRELMARISAILKRKGGKVRENKKEVFGGLVIDVDGRSVTVDGKKADLTPKEYDLLFYLVKNKGVAMSRESILSDVWGYTFFGEDRTVDTHIKMLRSNLGVYRDHIVTLRGMGYKFVEKIEE